ncbi:MAG TPA: electron transfer flavoprotein subunit alpha/FixB family protein [Pontiella sp.]
MSTKKELWVFAEQVDGVIPSSVYELLSQGRILCNEVGYRLCAALLSNNRTASLSQELFNFGAKKVYTIEDPKLEYFQNDYYSTALAQLINEQAPKIILYSATSIGRCLAPSIAAKIGTGLTADCTELNIDPKTKLLLQTRAAYGGNIMATIICPKHHPQMATVRPNVFTKNKLSENESGELIHYNVDLSSAPDRMRRRKTVYNKNEDSSELHTAQFIVSGGRGIGRPENFRIIKDLAEELNAAVGASRAITDAGWVSENHLVGQSGRTVRPKVYISCGISGAIQHQVGMQKSDLIIAINNDSNAPIFDIADIGLVGDLHKIIPELQKQLAVVNTKTTT